MKNSLTTLALVLAAAAPAAFIIELAGTSLPAIVDSSHLFGAFMLTFLAKILSADYATAAQLQLADPAITGSLPASDAVKSALRLAA